MAGRELIKIGVFYDGNYFLHVSNYYNYFHPLRQRISLPGFHLFLRQLVAQMEGVELDLCRITGAHYFRGRLSALETSQRGNQLYNDRVFDDILMSVGVVSHFLPLRNRGGKKEEKGIDVWLALEAYEHCRCQSFDVLILISSDGEYVPLIRKINALGVRTMVLNWEFTYTDIMGREVVTRTSQDLLQEVIYPISAHELIEEGLATQSEWVQELFSWGESHSSRDEDDRDDDNYSLEDTLFNSPDEMSEVFSGEIININLSRGYGFIKYPPNNLFFYHEDVKYPNFSCLSVGDTVCFTISYNTEGQEVAKFVRLATSDE